MIFFKGFSFPTDIPLFVTSFAKVLKWNRIVKVRGFNNIISELERHNETKPVSFPDESLLIKYHRIIYFYLKKILRHRNPCIIASLSLLDICRNKGIGCILVVGADKDKKSILGHSWVETINGAINENSESLKKYVRMVEI